MQETFDGKNNKQSFYNQDSRVKQQDIDRSINPLWQRKVKNTNQIDQPSQIMLKASNKTNNVNIQYQVNDNSTWNKFHQNLEQSHLNDHQQAPSRVGFHRDTFISQVDYQMKKNSIIEGNDHHNIYEEDDNQSYDQYRNEDMRGTYQNSDSVQISSELFANIKQMKIFQYMKDYVKTLKKNKIIQRIWFCQLNNRWTQQRSLSVSFFMMSTCIIIVLLVCWLVILTYMFKTFDDTYHPNYQNSQKNQLLNSLSSAQNSLQSLLKRTDNIHRVVISIFQSQLKHKNNPFYDFQNDSQILKGKKDYISIKQSVEPKDENNLGFKFNNKNLPLTYNFFQWAAFKNEKNYLDISIESQKTLDEFDVVSYFLKDLIGHATYSQSFSYYCSFDRDELVIYYPAGVQYFLKDMDSVDGYKFHPQDRDWYSSIIKNNLQYTNQTYISSPYVDQVTGQPTVTMSTPLRDYVTNSFLQSTQSN